MQDSSTNFERASRSSRTKHGDRSKPTNRDFANTPTTIPRRGSDRGIVSTPSADESIEDRHEDELLNEIVRTHRQGSNSSQSNERKQLTLKKLSTGRPSTHSRSSKTSQRHRTEKSDSSPRSRRSKNRRNQDPEQNLKDELLKLKVEEASSLHSHSSYSVISIGSTPIRSRRSSRSTNPHSDLESIATEQGLNEERFPSYYTADDNPSVRNFSDNQSLYSVNSETSHRANNHQYLTVDGRLPTYLPSSTTSSVRSVKLSSERRTKHTNSSVRNVNGSGNITHTFESPSRLPSGRRSEADLPTAQHTEYSPLSDYESVLNHRRSHHHLIQQNNLSPSDRQVQYNLSTSPLSGKSSHRSDQISRKSSTSSHRSRNENVHHLTIAEEPNEVGNSESGINLHHSTSTLGSTEHLSNKRASINTGKSSSGRGSQRTHSGSGYSDIRNELGDNTSIGSATSIMLRATSRASRGSMTPNHVLEDPDDEILVGDEKDLHDASRIGDHEIVEQLLDLGTDVNCRNETDRTPMHWGAGNGHCDVVKILLERDTNVEAADKFGMNALLWASWFGHKKCIQLLLRAGANSTAKNKNGYTFLHCAAQNNHIMAASILSEDLQEYDRNITDDAGRTCLHVLSKYGHKEMLEKFVELECSVNAKDKGGNAPIHLSAKYGHADLLPILVNASANLEDKNSDHKTALHLAAEEGQLETTEELIKLGADVNAETEDEVCPLHLAVSGGHENIVVSLLNNGADIDAGNKHNQTPLHHAVVANKPSIVHLLTANGADPNVQDARHETPLHLIAENGYFEMAEILLHSDINLSLHDQRGKTALSVAARGSYITIVDMILKAERHHLWMRSPGTLHMESNGHAFMSSDNDNEDTMSSMVSYKPDNTAETQHIRTLLYKLANKYLKKGEWRKLAFQWGFTDSQVQSVEEQYIDERSYREHGYRMLLIWLNGCMLRDENPVRSLFEGLVAIQRKDLAEIMRTKANTLPADRSCIIS